MNFDELKEYYSSGSCLTDFINLNKKNPDGERTTSLADIVSHLHCLDQREQLYKDYYALGHDTLKKKHFLEQIPLNTLLRYGMQFPDMGLVAIKHNYAESLLFSMQHDFDVMITKHPNYSPVISHAHKFFEVVFVLEGSCTHIIENHSFDMTQGDLCIIAPDTNHELHVFSDDTILLNIIIRQSTFSDIFFNLLRGENILSYFFLSIIYSKKISDYIVFHTFKDDTIVQMILTMLLEFDLKKPYYAELINSEIVTFFIYLIRNYAQNYEMNPNVSENEIQSYSLIGYIQNNYKTVTLHTLSNHFHFSEAYTSRLIKKTTGKTYTQLLLELRMKRASQLLTSTDISISDLCEEIGYLNPEHLIRTFKKYYGTTPAKYRSNYKI